MTRDTVLNMWLHYSWYLQWAEFTNLCLIQCLINSLSSCVYCRGGYTVSKERGSVFEVVFSKSLENNWARGWTPAVGREATTTFPLQVQNWGLPWPCLLHWITIVIYIYHQKYNVLRWQNVNREKTETEQHIATRPLLALFSPGLEYGLFATLKKEILQSSAVYPSLCLSS